MNLKRHSINASHNDWCVPVLDFPWTSQKHSHLVFFLHLRQLCGEYVKKKLLQFKNINIYKCRNQHHRMNQSKYFMALWFTTSSNPIFLHKDFPQTLSFYWHVYIFLVHQIPSLLLSLSVSVKLTLRYPHVPGCRCTWTARSSVCYRGKVWGRSGCRQDCSSQRGRQVSLWSSCDDSLSTSWRSASPSGQPEEVTDVFVT